MKTLKELLRNTLVTALHGDDSAAVAGLVYDSRAIGPGDCFFAVRGTQNDGHDFIPAAVAKGAAAVVCERLPEQTAADVTFDQLAAHIEHWLDLGGEDVIALGGDWDGATVPAFLSDASKMPEFQNMLSKHFGKTVMQKLCSDNALAFFERY